VRLLIYGFGPYQQFKENITEKILTSFPKRRGVKKIIFPVRFDKSQFIRALREHCPDAVLGLGRCSEGQRLRIERRAANRKRKNKASTIRPILSGGSKWISTSLRLKKGRETKFSKDAGDYVCNYSMYVILDYIKRHHLATRFGFIHIPHQYDSGTAKNFLLRVIRGICK